MPKGPLTTRAREHRVVADLLAELRLNAGLTQQQLAMRLGRPQSYVGKYESGARRIDVMEVREICHALDVDLPQFAQQLDERLRRNAPPAAATPSRVTRARVTRVRARGSKAGKNGLFLATSGDFQMAIDSSPGL